MFLSDDSLPSVYLVSSWTLLRQGLHWSRVWAPFCLKFMVSDFPPPKCTARFCRLGSFSHWKCSTVRFVVWILNSISLFSLIVVLYQRMTQWKNVVDWIHFHFASDWWRSLLRGVQRCWPSFSFLSKRTRPWIRWDAKFFCALFSSHHFF